MSAVFRVNPDPVFAAITRCRNAIDALGEMPENDDSPEMRAWEARSVAVDREWDALIEAPPKTLAGCAAFARFLSARGLFEASDTSAKIAFKSLASALDALT